MIKRKIKNVIQQLLLTKAIKCTQWWNNRYYFTSDFKPQPYFRADYTRNYDMMILGSETAAVDYEFMGAKALNLSTGYQPLSIDEKILHFYHSYLRRGAYVLFTFNPYRVGSKEKLNADYYSRFIKPLPLSERNKYGDYYAANVSLLDNSHIPTSINLNLFMSMPILFQPFQAIKALIYDAKSMTREVFAKMQYIYDEPWSLSPKDIERLERMCKFCIERDYKPVVVINPCSNQIGGGNSLNKLKSIFNNECVLFLDLTKETNISLPQYYINSIFLNKDGRIEFSKIIKSKLQDA